MSKFGVNFAARDIVLPGTYATVNADAMTPPRGVASRALAIIATAQGGEVGGVTRITSPDQIRTTLVGGVGAELAELAMAPSGEVQGAAEVLFFRVNEAVAATLDLGDATLTAVIAGKIGNGASAKRTTNTDGSVDLVLEHKYLGLAETYRDLGNVLEVTYVGANIAPTAAIAVATGVATLTLTGDDTFAFDSDTFPTVEALADEINNTSEWTARVVGSLSGVLTADLPAGAITLDANDVGVVNIAGKAYEYALADSRIATATAVAAAANADTGYQYFSGGTEGTTPTITEWQAALTLAGEHDVHGIVLGSGDTATIVAARAHVNSASDAKNRKERLLYVGLAKQASKTDLITNLKALAVGVSGARVIIAGSEPQLVNAQTGRLQTYPSYYLAAMAAGMKAGNRPEMPLTNKQVSIFGTSYTYSVEELEDLLESGIMPVHFDNATGSYIITQGITSWTRDANVVYRKTAGMDIADYLNKGIRQRLARFIGKVGDELTMRRILLETTGFLSGEVRSTANPEGVLTAGLNPVTGAEEPAFRDVEVLMDGFDLVGIRYEAHPVGEIAYIMTTAYLTPVKLVARA